MPIKNVGFNPEVILRRLYKIGVIFSEKCDFQKNCSKIVFMEKSKELLFF